MRRTRCRAAAVPAAVTLAAVMLAAVALVGCSGASSAEHASPTAIPTAASGTTAPAGTITPTTVDAPLASAALLGHAVRPAVAADDAGGLLLAAERGSPRDVRSVVAAFRGADGRWSSLTVLTRHADQGGPTVAAGGHGQAAVGWTTYGAGAMTESVRIRDASGRWGAPHVLVRNADFTRMASLDVNRRGDVASLSESGETFRASARIDGRWTSTRVPDCEDGSLALDDRGAVHVACIGYSDRGAQGQARVWTQRPGGPLTLEHRLGTAAALSLQVEPDGRETLLVGVGTPGSTDASGQLVLAGAYRVLRQTSPGGPLSTLWSHATRGHVAVAADGDRLQVAWEDYRGHKPRTTTLLRVQTVLPGAGPVTTVHRDASRPDGRGDDGFDFALAVPGTGPGALLWRIWGNAAPSKVGSTRLTPLVGTGTGATVTLPGASRDTVDHCLLGCQQLAVSPAGQVDLTWLHEAATRRNSIGDRVTADGTVEVARLHLAG
jgi:hypothetical protein